MAATPRARSRIAGKKVWCGPKTGGNVVGGTWLRFLRGADLSAGQLEAEDVGVVDDAFERFVARRQESRVVAESVGHELAETLEQGQQLFDVLLRVLGDDVGGFNLMEKKSRYHRN